MTDQTAWAIDISQMADDFSTDTATPALLKLPSELDVSPDTLVALMDKGRCCGLAVVREDSTLLVLPVSFQPNLLTSPLYEPIQVPPKERVKLFGTDESHLRKVLHSISVGPTAHAIATESLPDTTPNFTCRDPKNIILYGPPGTGKTFSVPGRALELLGQAPSHDATPEQIHKFSEEIHERWDACLRAGNIVFCTFHQAFGYEEFVEGLRAETDKAGNVHYNVEPGIFKSIVRAALDRPTESFVLVIDEINRANVARVFGELITLLEPDKRIGAAAELRLTLPASKERFGVPPNLHVLGTMNTADRSIALMDVALRRRFTYEEMMPDAGELKKKLEKANVDAKVCDLVVKVFNKLNARLRFLYDREHQIGHAYFMGVTSLADLRAVFADRILPLLQEYFFGQWDKIALVLGYPVKKDGTPEEERSVKHEKGTFLTAHKVLEKSVLGFDHDDYVDQIAWDIHPNFRSRGEADDAWLKQAFNELIGPEGA